MNIGELVERLTTLGVPIGAATEIIAQAYAAGTASIPHRKPRKPVQMTIETILPKAPKATRIPPDFKPDIAFAESLGLTRRKAQTMAEEFCDYWAGAPGKDGIKSDWPATWRNRCRAVAERLGTVPRASSGNGAVDPRKLTPAEWAPILSVYAKTSNWNQAYGPEPGLPGSLVPAQRLL